MDYNKVCSHTFSHIVLFFIGTCSHKLSLILNKSFMQSIPYRHILGNLRYLVSCTRSDLSYSIGFLSRFTKNLGPRHWEALKRVLRYLKYSRDMTLTYKALLPSPKWDMVVLQGWTYADCGRDRDTSQSSSGFVFTFSSGVSTWRTKKQAIVALSSIEVEYIMATLVAKEGLWLQSIFSELDIIHITEFRLWCDNQSCIKITRNPKITDKI